MKEEEIEYTIENIMINNGPDGHCDGADIVTDFVMALLRGDGPEWVRHYEELQEGRSL